MIVRAFEAIRAVELPAEVEKKMLAAFHRSRLSDAPNGPHLELQAEQIARVLAPLPVDLKLQLAELDVCESAIISVIAIGRFLSVPVKVLGGMFDYDGEELDAGGNGWGQLAGAVRDHGQPYTAGYMRRQFGPQLSLWIADYRMVEAKAYGLKKFENKRHRVDGSKYDSTGNKYPRYHARMRRYFPAEVWRVGIRLSVTGEIVRWLYRALHRDNVGPALRAWKQAAHGLQKRAGVLPYSVDQKLRDRAMSLALQYSKREVSDARYVGLKLPTWRNTLPRELTTALFNRGILVSEVRAALRERHPRFFPAGDSLSKKDPTTSSSGTKSKDARADGALPAPTLLSPPTSGEASEQPASRTTGIGSAEASGPASPPSSKAPPGGRQAQNAVPGGRKPPQEPRKPELPPPEVVRQAIASAPALDVLPVPVTPDQLLSEADRERRVVALAQSMGADLTNPLERIAVEELEAESRWRTRWKRGADP